MSHMPTAFSAAIFSSVSPPAMVICLPLPELGSGDVEGEGVGGVDAVGEVDGEVEAGGGDGDAAGGGNTADGGDT